MAHSILDHRCLSPSRRFSIFLNFLRNRTHGFCTKFDSVGIAKMIAIWADSRVHDIYYTITDDLHMPRERESVQKIYYLENRKTRSLNIVKMYDVFPSP